MPIETHFPWVLKARHFFKTGRWEVPKVAATVPAEARPRFLSSAELVLFRQLQQAVGTRAIVCPHTRLSDVIYLANATEFVQQAVRLNLKRIDFLICDATSGASICAVQTEPIMDRRRRTQHDFMRQVLATAKLPLIRLDIENPPSVEELRHLLDEIIAKHRTKASSIATVHSNEQLRPPTQQLSWQKRLSQRGSTPPGAIK
ncbi:hypothetical protein K227x_09140 [Rubripirellula lacrimiformis]|uniref:DUF2726 domain-containing protein n=1 Tax=Rubripirellula lacrimiformis TaxID=1930273 RepID=A0A517N5W2_9BACT|nr:DUF2726 domain-containing protein [Rubripirellula lacrimiformis]QDT02536.1 hypothetical protein K227x_09140 [Rubripirellula lacrimiformis]